MKIFSGLLPPNNKATVAPLNPCAWKVGCGKQDPLLGQTIDAISLQAVYVASSGTIKAS